MTMTTIKRMCGQTGDGQCEIKKIREVNTNGVNVKESCFLACEAVSLGKWLPTFRKYVGNHSVTFQTTWIFSSTAVLTSNHTT